MTRARTKVIDIAINRREEERIERITEVKRKELEAKERKRNRLVIRMKMFVLAIVC